MLIVLCTVKEKCKLFYYHKFNGQVQSGKLNEYVLAVKAHEYQHTLANVPLLYLQYIAQ